VSSLRSAEASAKADGMRAGRGGIAQ